MWTGKSIFWTALVVVGALFAVVGGLNSFTTLDAKEIMVCQSAWEGELTVYTDPGVKKIWWGHCTRYPRREQYSFSRAINEGKTGVDESITSRFNDGGTAKLSGVVSWEMPLAVETVVRLHKEFGSFHAIEQQLIRPMIEKVVYNVGPTMSTIESAGERRPDIPQYMDDQIQNGPYLTKTVVETQKDPITGNDKQVKLAKIEMDEKGLPKRSAPSQIREYGIHMLPVTISDIHYDDAVEGQIKERQKATNQVQISVANARRAEQDAITAEQQGRANAATAKWTQETINAKEIAEAEKELQVQKLNALKAEQFKKEQILQGEGTAEKQRLIMAANGALDQKLEAYKEVNKYWASAFEKYQGSMVPGFVMGGGASSGTGSAVNNAQMFMELMSAKAAHDLGLDLGVRGSTKK